MNFVCTYICVGIPVSYRDVESIDPEFAKNLQVNCGMCTVYSFYFANVQ